MSSKPVSLRPPLPPSEIYPQGSAYEAEAQIDRLTSFCMWADANGLNPAEFLLPILDVDAPLAPYAFERNAPAPPSREAIDALAPWHYEIDFAPGVSTRGIRFPDEWHYHHHRAATLVELAERIYGAGKADVSVLDVASHCGVFSLEFAARGFGHVHGVDLRQENVEQARFLAAHFNVPNASFSQANARDLSGIAPADIVFCGGLLYHVTFPVELMRTLAALTKEILIFDTVCQRHPFSGFHLVGGKDVSFSPDGDLNVEFSPTYRAVIDLLQMSGFREIYEVLGANRADTPLYCTNNVRSFVAAKPGVARLSDFVATLNA